MKISQLLLGALTVGLAAGCAVGPNYRPPKTAAPANWSEAQLGGATNAPVQVVAWWKTFKDPELTSLIERAVKANYDLRIAEAQLLQARALRAGAAWNLGPTIDAAGSYTDAKRARNAQTSTLAKPHTDLYDAHFDASWEIDIFGGLRRQLEQATALYGSVEENRRAVLISVLSEVALNYVNIRGFQYRLDIARKNIKAQQEALDQTRTRFNAGLTSELDVKQAQSLLATTQAQLPGLDTSLKQTVHQLGVLLGQQPGALREELAATAPIPATPPSVPVGMPSDLLRRRPDVRTAERQLAAATANIGVQTAELFPKLTLLGTGGFQSLSAGDWIAPGGKYWSAGPTVTWRLLDFGRIRAQVKAANAQQQQAFAFYEKTVLTAFQDVEDALVAYNNEQLHYRSLVDAVDADRGAVALANKLYKEGLGDFLAVLTAERSLYQDEDQLATSQATVTANLVTLYKALGGGWEDQPATAENGK
ncbi:MAG TPA: efflux transporter outer membrane subunit [Verrucomicrobiae bacterium]|nr:efflux transporter outer membrane subunit [Verrucomicrobiae bacterium]